MPNFEVKIRGFAELQRALRDYPHISEPILQDAIEGTGVVFGKNTHKDDPVPFRTGNLLQSFRFKSARLQARWFPTASYAAAVELGTRPHVILPRRASVLRWSEGGGGRYVTSASGRRYYKSTKGSFRFAKRVNHPGSRARPFMGKIVKKSEQDVNRLFGQAGDQITKAIASRI